jgi:putative oxidoreductase
MEEQVRSSRVLSAILAPFFVIVGAAQLLGVSGFAESFTRWGYPGWFRIAVGIAQIAFAVVLLAPKATAPAAGALVVIMLGAIYTHVQAGEFPMLVLNALLIALLAWLGWMRRPVVT